MDNTSINALRPRTQTQLDLSNTTEQLQLQAHDVITGNDLGRRAWSGFATLLLTCDPNSCWDRIIGTTSLTFSITKALPLPSDLLVYQNNSVVCYSLFFFNKLEIVFSPSHEQTNKWTKQASRISSKFLLPMTSSRNTERLVDRKHLCKWLSCYTNSTVIFYKDFSNLRKSVGQLSARGKYF